MAITTPPTISKPPTLTRRDARRIAVRAQLLDAERPRDLAAVVDRLTFLQLDPTAAIAPSADLVTWSRIGNAYRPEQLRQALERDRTLFEHHAQPVETEPVLAMVRPMADLRLYLADMKAWGNGGGRAIEWLTANAAFHQAVLDQLSASGPLMSRDIADTSAVSWQSTGWRNDRNVNQMLEFLTSRGEVAVSGRRGKERLWDLASRIYPPKVKAVPSAEAKRIRNARWLRSLGITRAKNVGDAGITVHVEGTPGEWRLDPDASAAGFKGRTALLSPFDRLIHDRKRSVELFGFEYLLEMYKPKEQRRWGYFALPVLHQDQLVGKVDAEADRKASVLRVNAVHEDVPFTKAMTVGVKAEIAALASWLGLDVSR